MGTTRLQLFEGLELGAGLAQLGMRLVAPLLRLRPGMVALQFGDLRAQLGDSARAYDTRVEIGEIRAAEDIKAADGVSPDYYSKDELVATVTTDANGVAEVSDLPVGKYYVKEVGTAYGISWMKNHDM